MELRAYWRVIRRYLPLVLGLPLLVGLAYPLLSRPSPTAYAAGMRFVVGIQPEEPPDDQYTYDRYYTWLTAEYLIDDLSEVVKSRRFAEDVAALAGLAVPSGAIQGATAAGKLHRILSITITWPDPDELGRLAAATEELLATGAGRYFSQLSTENAVISLIDPPSVYPLGRSLRDRLDLPLRLGLALAAGLALAFLLDYLDDTVRGPGDLHALGLVVLGEVPASGRGTLALRRRRAP